MDVHGNGFHGDGLKLKQTVIIRPVTAPKARLRAAVAAAPRNARPQDLHFEALSDVTNLTPPGRDWKQLTRTAAGQLNRYAKELRDINATPEQIAAFGPWWYANDWRGQKRQPPKPADVAREWPRYRNGDRTNGTHQQSTGPFAGLDPAERERLQALADKINARRAAKRAAQRGAFLARASAAKSRRRS